MACGADGIERRCIWSELAIVELEVQASYRTVARLDHRNAVSIMHKSDT